MSRNPPNRISRLTRSRRCAMCGGIRPRGAPIWARSTGRGGVCLGHTAHPRKDLQNCRFLTLHALDNRYSRTLRAGRFPAPFISRGYVSEKKVRIEVLETWVSVVQVVHSSTRTEGVHNLHHQKPAFERSKFHVFFKSRRSQNRSRRPCTSLGCGSRTYPRRLRHRVTRISSGLLASMRLSSSSGLRP
jgi:hypothetical protein